MHQGGQESLAASPFPDGNLKDRFVDVNCFLNLVQPSVDHRDGANDNSAPRTFRRTWIRYELPSGGFIRMRARDCYVSPNPIADREWKTQQTVCD